MSVCVCVVVRACLHKFVFSSVMPLCHFLLQLSFRMNGPPTTTETTIVPGHGGSWQWIPFLCIALIHIAVSLFFAFVFDVESMLVRLIHGQPKQPRTRRQSRSERRYFEMTPEQPQQGDGGNRPQATTSFTGTGEGTAQYRVTQ